MPVSWICTSTSTRRSSCLRSSTRMSILPVSVNLMALPSRLVMICCRRSESPITCSGTSLCTSSVSSSLVVGAGRQQHHHFVQRFTQGKRNMLQHQLAGFQLGEVQHVVDDGQQVVGRAFDGLQIIGLGRAQIGFQHLAGEADHAVERSTQLVRHVGQEFGLDARRLLRAFFARSSSTFWISICSRVSRRSEVA